MNIRYPIYEGVYRILTLISKYVSYSLLLFTPYGSGSENPRLKKIIRKRFL